MFLNERFPLNSQQERRERGRIENVRSHRGLQATDIFRIDDIGLRIVQRMILLSAFYITKWYRADSTYGKSIHRDDLRANYPSNHPAIQPLHHSTLLSKNPHSSLDHRRYQLPAGPAIFKKEITIYFFIERKIFFDFSSNDSTDGGDIRTLYPFLANSFRHDRREPTINQRKHRQLLLFPSDLLTGQGQLNFRPALAHSLNQQSISDL